jgi:hypothetical protein
VNEGKMGGTCSTQGTDMRSYKILVGNHEGRDHSEDVDVDGRIKLERILGKYGWKIWNDTSGSG